MPRIRRVTTSEVDRQLHRDRARDFDDDAPAFVVPRGRAGGRDREQQLHLLQREEEWGLNNGFSRIRLDGARSSRNEDPDLNEIRERQRRRELLAREEHDEILSRIERRDFG